MFNIFIFVDEGLLFKFKEFIIKEISYIYIKR